jgi:hypothetical protein
LSDEESGGVAPYVDGGKSGVHRFYYQRPVAFSSVKTAPIYSKRSLKPCSKPVAFNLDGRQRLALRCILTQVEKKGLDE